ncbi:MAG TPA: sulfatase-like hydrolase/transferase, partial [Bacteroidales bacterium]|nr:sulfatase-like hydrolase/transferase [Bacteroidales bacterium]
MKKLKLGNIYQICTNVCLIFVLFFVSACSGKTNGEGELTAKPNIVLIVADDLGFGDLGCYGATKIETPTIDKLANEGVKFSRAYASSSVCSPSRYSILTGRYSWRTRLKWGVLKYYDTPLIEQEEATIASLLRREGYHTACVGKWHLGMDWALNENAPENPEKSVFNS